MKIVLLHDDIPPNAREDELDVFVQCAAIEGALQELGHTHARLPFALDLATTRARLRELKPDAVFNLVEAVEGQGRLLPLAPMLLDAMAVPYTGSHTEALFLTTNKVLAKRWLSRHGVPTPEFVRPWSAERGAPGKLPPGRWIIKPTSEEGSVGLDEESVVDAADPDLVAKLQRVRDRLGDDIFAERYIDGREFNLSMLGGAMDTSGGPAVPEVLPPAEIHFTDYPPEKPHVVGYRAKWDDQSFEFHHTPRSFEFPPADAELLKTLHRFAGQCWDVFGLRGYVRVDFRIDAGQPSVLELNANPCLSPDAGFYAATQRAGLRFADVIARILTDALRP